jgi:hypothetical protein
MISMLRKRGAPALSVLVCLCICSTAAAAPKKGAEKAGKKEEVVQRRVIGSIIFPERGDIIRESSALKILTPEVIEITTKAMDYVRRSQQADGSWGDRQFPKSSGVTALCCMALFAEGSLPKVGYSGKKLDKGIAFILSCGKKDGLLVAKDTYRYGPMYDHTWSTYVLLQAYGNAPWYPDMKQKISRGIQAILRAQKPDGGWRYSLSPLGRSDVSVTSSVLATLRMARISGFGVSEDRIKRGENFVIRCGKPRRPEDEGTFCYREGGERGSASTTAAGLLALFSRGLYEHKYIIPCKEHIAYTYRRAHIEDMKDSPHFRYFHFGCYYVSQVMYMAQDQYWIPWYRKFATVLKATQDENGSFKDRHGNVVYPTAISALILQAPLGYMPQYLR